MPVLLVSILSDAFHTSCICSTKVQIRTAAQPAAVLFRSVKESLQLGPSALGQQPLYDTAVVEYSRCKTRAHSHHL